MYKVSHSTVDRGIVHGHQSWKQLCVCQQQMGRQHVVYPCSDTSISSKEKQDTAACCSEEMPCDRGGLCKARPNPLLPVQNEREVHRKPARLEGCLGLCPRDWAAMTEEDCAVDI